MECGTKTLECLVNCTTKIKNFEHRFPLMIRVALVAALMFLGGASAELGSFSLQHELPLAIDGSMKMETVGDAVLEGTEGNLAANLYVENGVLTRIVQRASGYISPSEPELGIQYEQTVREIDVPLENQWMQLERLEGFQLVARDANIIAEQGSAQETAYIGQLGTSKIIRHESVSDISFTFNGYEAKPFEYAIRGGQLTARVTDGAVAITEGDIFLSNALVTADDAYEASERVEIHPGQFYDPIRRQWFGDGTHEEFVWEYHLLRVQDANLQLQVQNAPIHMYSEEVHIDVLGAMQFPASKGMVTVGEETHQLEGQDLLMRGDMQIQSQSGSKPSSTGSGDLVEVKYAQQSHSYDWAVAAGIGAGLLALGGAIIGLGKSGAFVAGYARVHGDEVLEHPGRAKTYEFIKENPGLHFNDLRLQMNLGQSTLNYHLRVLEKNDFVTRVKDGRYARFFDRQSGQYSAERKDMASALRNETTAAIALHVMEHPGVAQKDLSGAFGIAASTVSWHMDRLCTHGLVEKERVANRVHYYMGDGWMQLPETELARFGIAC